jgi:hypothetical protein
LEDVLIPPVPSKIKKAKAEESSGINYELPSFELPEFDEATEEEPQLEEKPEEKPEPEKPDYTQLPFDIVHKVIRAVCFTALLLWLILIVLLAFYYSTFNTLLGLSPVLLTIIVTYILVDKYHLESGFLMIFPFIFTGIFLMLGYANLLRGINYVTLSSINIIFGLLFEAVITVYYSFLRRKRKKANLTETPAITEKEEPAQEFVEPKKDVLVIKLDSDEDLNKFVSSIEDKAKAINAVIGRVYSVKHGGTEPMRKKIKIDPAHYNEINELKNEEPGLRRETAARLLKKISDRLALLQKPEIGVFDSNDLSGLVNLERSPEGNDNIIDVLAKNDKDPVNAYYLGAVEFCEQAMKDLQS